MSEPRKKFVQKGSNFIDNSIIDKFEELIKDDQNLEEIKQFNSKGFIKQITQTWSYYSHVNDNAKFTSATQLIFKFIKLANENAELVEIGVELIKDILTNYSKPIYRALSSTRASLTNPIVRLLNEIIIFQNGALIDDFLVLFDFQLSVLPKLLIPTKQESSNIEATKSKEFLSIRYCFIRFLLNLLKYSNPLVRKDWLMNNGKIISNWIKYVSSNDSDALVLLTLETWDEKILKEASFKKLTKLKVFNEWNLTKLLPLYYNPDLKVEFNDFILSIGTDAKYGLAFTSDDSWFTNINSTSTIIVNKKTFKTHNKLLYGLITNLKPWDDDTQLNTTVTILAHNQELIPPFMNYLASMGLHDPKLTSFWLGQSLLLSKLLRLEISTDLVDYAGKVPNKFVISEFIAPSVFNRVVLSKCLQSESFLIRQLSLNLLIDSLTKLNKFLALYDSKGWDKLELINHVYHLVPELSTIITCLNDSYSKSPTNKIILISLLMTINNYSIFNDKFNYSQAISKPYSEVINQAHLGNIDLVLLTNFFQLQQDDSSQIKWWNTNGQRSSLFSSLVRIASTTENHSIKNKIINLLSLLLKQTVVFNYEQVFIDPIIIFVHSLSNVLPKASESEVSKFLKLIDETISRLIRSPFKYLDQSNENKRISPFILTLLEQWKFVEKTSDFSKISKWLILFLRYSVMIGEPLDVILNSFEQLEIDIDYKPYLAFDEASASILYKDEDLQNDSFFEFVTIAPSKKILSSNHQIVSEFDVIGCLSRIPSLVKTSTSSDVLSNILSKLGNYLYTHPGSFNSMKYFQSLYLTETNENGLFVSSALNDIFRQLDSFNKEEYATVVGERLKGDFTGEALAILGDSLWSLSKESLKDISNKELKSSVLTILLERKVLITSDELIENLQPDTLSILAKFIEYELVKYTSVNDLFNQIIKTDSLSLLKSLSTNSSLVHEILELIQKRNDDLLTTYFISGLTDYSIIDKALLSAAKDKSIEFIKNDDHKIPIEQLLNIFIHVDLTQEDKEFILNYALNSSIKFTSVVVRLVNSIGSSDSQITRNYITKSILYLTKVFAEFPNPSELFFQFVDSFKDLVKTSKIWSNVPKSNLNALIEVIFTKWIKSTKIIELAAILVTVGGKSLFEFGKLLPILINNEDLYKNDDKKLKFLTSLIIWRLYTFDTSKNSTISIQQKILSFYNGTAKIEDILLYDILENIEGVTNNSWVNKIYSWEFLNLLSEDEEDLIGEVQLIEEKKEGLIVNLNKKLVMNGMKNFNVERIEVEKLTTQTELTNWSKVDAIYKKSLLSENNGYDPLFLSLLIINNDELFTISNNQTENESESTTIKTNIKKLIESDLLSSILINLSSSNKMLVRITIQLLSTILGSLKSETNTFKDKQIFELLLTKILFTYSKEDSYIPPVIVVLISNLVPILNNPGHHLYEKAFRWILKSPLIKPFEFPLYNEITTFNHTEKSEESEVYYKQLEWLLNCIVDGIRCQKDVDFLKIKGFYEWCFNLLNNQYVNVRISLLVLRIIEKIIKIDLEILVSRFGLLSFIEQKVSELLKIVEIKEDKQSLINLQKLINLKELGLEIGLIGSNKKRVRDWTSDDIPQFVKRVVGSE